MRFGIVRQRHGEYKSGLYFEKYPEIPVHETGKLFKYRDNDRQRSMEDIVANLAHEMTTKTIVSTYRLPWKSEAYVLLGGEVWRISGVMETEKNQAESAIVRVVEREYTISLRRVANATGAYR
jgi:hypothetical protein